MNIKASEVCEFAKKKNTESMFSPNWNTPFHSHDIYTLHICCFPLQFTMNMGLIRIYLVMFVLHGSCF